jgi:flagellar basal body-associated protein FliL
MATQAIEQTPDEAAVDAPVKKGKSPLIMAAAGVLAGAVIGLLIVGPMLARRRGTAPAAVQTTEPASAAVTHEIQNLVLNPAGTEGRRFLMVTATFELKDAAIEPRFKEHEAEIRDRILALLGKKTVEELSDMAQRDRIKGEVLSVVAPLFPKGSLLKVFFPQFVIQ